METKIESKYERLRKIGIGSYGVVFKCINRQTGQIVAIKRYSENDTDPIIRKIAMREVRMLRQLKHPNLIQLIEVFRRKRRLHLVFEYCELTILDVIEKYAQNCPLNLIRKIIWQLVNGVSYCHRRNCIHRDIKPENILINQYGVVKLCDFGFARNTNNNRGQQHQQQQRLPSANVGRHLQLEQDDRLLGVPLEQTSHGHHQTSGQPAGFVAQQLATDNKENCSLVNGRQALTEYVATRWYRAPELLVGDVYYDTKIDIWAIGCVTAELMRGEPIWPGKTDLDQLYMIKSSLGPLTPGQTHTLLTQNPYDQTSIERLLSQTDDCSEPLERRLPARVGEQGIEFVLICLQMDPIKRPTSDELLQHPYIQSARMAQFVKGASHAAGNELAGANSAGAGSLSSSGGIQVQGGAMIATATGSSSSSSHNRQPPHRLSNMRGGDSIEIRSSQQQQRRSNSQALILAANQAGGQPASKRLVVASENGPGVGRRPSGAANGKPTDSLMPAQVARQAAPSSTNTTPANDANLQCKRKRPNAGKQSRNDATEAAQKPSLVPISRRQAAAIRTNGEPLVVMPARQQRQQAVVDSTSFQQSLQTKRKALLPAPAPPPQPSAGSTSSPFSGFVYTSKRLSQSNGNLFQLSEPANGTSHRSTTYSNPNPSPNSISISNLISKHVSVGVPSSNGRTNELGAPTGRKQTRRIQQQVATSNIYSLNNHINNVSSASSSSPNSLGTAKSPSISFLPTIARHRI